MKKSHGFALTVATLLCLMFFVGTRIREEYARVASPDGRYYAVADYPAFAALISRAPGGGSDKSGRVTIYTVGGQSCGSARVPILRMFQDLEWQTDSAEIRLVAQWDLLRRTVEETDD